MLIILESACLPNPCQNGGGCQFIGSHGYVCMCPSDCIGYNCEICSDREAKNQTIPTTRRAKTRVIDHRPQYLLSCDHFSCFYFIVFIYSSLIYILYIYIRMKLRKRLILKIQKIRGLLL